MKLKHILIAIGGIIALLLLAKFTGIIGGTELEKVTAESVSKKDIVETVTASGKIQPETEVKLSSEVSGEVTELLVKEGDFVKKGQLLCRVRPDILQSGYDRSTASYSAQKASVAAAEQQFEQSKGNFTNAELIYKRNVELHNKKVISIAEFDAAKAAFITAKTSLESAKQNFISAKFMLAQSGANVKEAKANLARATIFAPVDGVVSKLSIELGDRILGTSQMAGTEIMRIANLQTMEVNVDVNENDINRVKVGDKAVVEVDAFADKKFKGIVTEIASSSNSSNSTGVDQVTNFSVKIRLLNEENSSQAHKFKPGLSATVDIESEYLNGLAIPIQSVFVKEKKKKVSDEEDSENKKTNLTDKQVKQFVYVLNPKTNMVKQIQVFTGIQNDQYIIVRSGLREGEQVITGPYATIQDKLKDGMKVEKTTKDKLFEVENKK
ncbi:MAG: efflux RND transporter periplasmic adaptor subunit [Sphingobacteriaceae bacterium]|nr:efflux RND transporter periplasmic adaptor subunit [Sphingobacteriaceae bacterium]